MKLEHKKIISQKFIMYEELSVITDILTYKFIIKKSSNYQIFTQIIRNISIIIYTKNYLVMKKNNYLMLSQMFFL